MDLAVCHLLRCNDLKKRSSVGPSPTVWNSDKTFRF